MASAYRWRRIADRAAFAARDGAGALSFRGRMWLLGGWNPRDKEHFPTVSNSEVWSSADGAEWTLEAPRAPWEGRHTAGYAVHEGRMWVVGGDCIQGHTQDDVWSSADGIRWERATPRAPWAPRVLHATAAFGGFLWVMGGQAVPQFAPGPEAFHNDVWRSRDGASWERVAEHAPWTPRGMIGGAAVHRGRMWLLGGGTYDTPLRPERLFFHGVWSTADGAHWDLAAANPPWHARQYHDVAVWDGKLWVLEGYAEPDGNRKDVWHSEDGARWTEVPDTPWAPRHAASVFVHDDALWIAAGNNMEPDVWRLERA